MALTFNDHGLLPPGDYPMTFHELQGSILVNGLLQEAEWDSEWRSHLVNCLEMMVHQLWECNITEIFINGSFVENKAHPNDIDGYFECDVMSLATGKLEQQLNLLDKDKIWTWNPDSRHPYRGYVKRQLPMWHKYRVELYPHYGFGPDTGILDENGNEQLFPAAFRKTRDTFQQKGIVKIIR